MRTSAKLNKIYKNAKEIEFDDDSKIIIMSDCHRGVGNWADDFARNQNTFFRALSYYYKEGFTYFELGDGDELWENKNFNDIVKEHGDVFSLMADFYRKNRLHMIYGNHDICKKKCKKVKKDFHHYFNEMENKVNPLFVDITIHEGLILKHKKNCNKMLLVHGHQGDFFCDTVWPLTRFLVRYFWNKLELVGVNDPTSTPKNYKRQNKIESKLTKWATENRRMLIAGHTHRPHMPKPGDALYFNDGSSVHPRGITGIEIVNGEISLVKWTIKIRENGNLYVDKDVLEGPTKLDEYFKKIKKS